MGMITRDQALTAAARLHALKGFPLDGAADAELARLFWRMAEKQEQLEWLVNTLIDRVGFYPGTEQIRAVFCTRFKPRDGVEANVAVSLPIYRTDEQCESEEKHWAFLEPSNVRQIAGNSQRIPDGIGKHLEIFGLSPEAKSIPAIPKTKGPITAEDVVHAKAKTKATR